MYLLAFNETKIRKITINNSYYINNIFKTIIGPTDELFIEFVRLVDYHFLIKVYKEFRKLNIQIICNHQCHFYI